jgi:hypothetical protein
VLLVTGALLLVLNRQYVLDTLHFWSFHPDASVSSIASRSTMTDQGKFTFYATRPEVEVSTVFNKNCSRVEQSTAILGCYTDDRIHLYSVVDSSIDGIKEVTAAHEMLHAVYQRLSDEDRKNVNALVEAEYDKVKTDPAFAERMAFYARTEPGERDNELHSIIGTEFGNISPELEAHYAKYFSNRSELLKLFNSYSDAFSRLDTQAKALAVQLDSLSKQIDADTADYNKDVKQLNADISSFNRRAASGQFSSQAAFNSERQALQVRVETVSGKRSAINSRVDKYESLREQYNDTVKQSNNLYKSIDSTLAPAPSV